MVKYLRNKILAALAVTLLIAPTLAPVASAAVVQAPLAQQLRDTQVRGLLPGGQFAKIWLGLQPEQPGATVTVTAEWDRAEPDSNGVGFFILDDEGLRGVGESTLSSLAIGAGSQNFFLGGPSNQQGASILVPGMAQYTVILFNDSAADANFTLTASGAAILDDSGQVTGVNSSVATPETSTEDSATTDEAAAVEADTPPAETATPEPVAPVADTSTTEAVTTTTATTETVAPPAEVPAATTAPVVTGEVRATTMQGELPEQDDQHFLGLLPNQRDGTISLMLTFDPQDNSELARRLNFWVLDEGGFTQYLRGTNPGEVAIAAGNRTFRGDTNERVASFNAAGLGQYTVIVYNNSRIPGSYSLTVEGGTLIDDSGQTITAQEAGAGLSSSTVVTGTETAPAASTTTTTTGTTTTGAATTGTTAPATTTSGRAGEAGGTYTVQSGDTLALIARDIYGDYTFYQQICAFNNIANCNVIEVGDVINLPTQAQLQSGATSTTTTAATATPAAAATTATPAATPAASATVTSTTGITSTTAPTTSTGVTATGRTTAPITTTTGTTTTGASTAAGGTAAASDETIVDALVADGRFTSLVEALGATGLDSVLEGAGPFTVFAPTDAAFAALPAGAFDQLLNDPSGQLTDILRYHVIAGRTLSEDLSNSMLATTVQGKSVRFEVQGNTVRVNGATLVTKDIETENGVVQVIDAVILPPPE